jgi:hypothetical protein
MAFSSYQVQEMIVTAVCTASNPYIFGAKELGSDGNAAPSSAEESVRIVMPVGGPETGLYRSPKRGDYVLVGKPGTDNYYLMGYIPKPVVVTAANKEQRIDTAETATVNPVLDNRGMVLRYQQTGKGKASDGAHYSEIGFYSEATAWMAANPGDYQPTATINPSDSPPPPPLNPPKIDRLNIRSTGDMVTQADNYSGSRAKRMEIVIDGGDDEKTLLQNAKSGDLAINAKHDVTISSDSSITLMVGRSSIAISDDGITIRSGKINSDVADARHSVVANTWDSKLVVSPIDGCVVTGPRTKINSIYGFSLQDGYGGSFSSDIGVARIGGIDIKLATMKLAPYVTSTVFQGIDLLLNIATMGAGIGDDRGDKGIDAKAGGGVPGVVSATSDMIKGCIQAGLTDGIDAKAEGYADLVGALVAAVKTASQIAEATANVLSLTIAVGEKSFIIRDGINFALAVTEAGLSLTCAIAIAVGKSATPVQKAALHLMSTALMHQEAVGLTTEALTKSAYVAPLAGASFIAAVGGRVSSVGQAITPLAKPITSLVMKYHDDPALADL